MTMSPSRRVGRRRCYIDAKAFTLGRAVEEAGCRELVMAERAEECEGKPVSVRGEAAQACAFWGTSPAWMACWS